TIPSSVTIPSYQGSATIAITPLVSASLAFESPVTLTMNANPSLYTIGTPSAATLYIADPTYPITTSPVPAPSGLISWWRAEADTIDSKGTANGVLHNSATFGSGIIAQAGQAFSLNGTGAHVHVTQQTPLQLTTAATIEGWVNYSSIGTWHEVVSKWDAVTGFNQRSYRIGTYP